MKNKNIVYGIITVLIITATLFIFNKNKEVLKKDGKTSNILPYLENNESEVEIIKLKDGRKARAVKNEVLVYLKEAVTKE